MKLFNLQVYKKAKCSFFLSMSSLKQQKFMAFLKELEKSDLEPEIRGISIILHVFQI